MDIGVLADYIVVVVIGVCLCTGYVIKESLTFVPNKYIPLILSVLGVAINAWVNDFIIAPEVILGGMLSGLASTGVYEAFKHLIEGKNKEE